MALHSFSVFVDDPLQPIPHKLTTTPVLSPTFTSGPSLATTTEKENLHPVTGEHRNPSDAQVKKRKKAVLTTKLYIPLVATKKTHDKSAAAADNAQLACRKRSSVPVPDPSSSTKKPRRGPDAERVSSRSRLCKVQGLPKLEEEAEPSVQVSDHVREVGVKGEKWEGDRVVAQVDISSKCYALPGTPLTDVSRAFDKLSIQSSTAEDTNDVQCAVEKPALSATTATATMKPTSSKSSYGKGKARPTLQKTTSAKSNSFSTPERKLIYSAFTFSSPSPTAERFAARSGPNEPVRFGDLKFNFTV